MAKLPAADLAPDGTGGIFPSMPPGGDTGTAVSHAYRLNCWAGCCFRDSLLVEGLRSIRICGQPACSGAGARDSPAACRIDRYRALRIRHHDRTGYHAG